MLFNLEWVRAPTTNPLVEGTSRGKFSEEVQQVESVIRRRFAMGSSMTEQRLKDELLKQEFSQTSVDRAIYQLISREVLAYTDRRTKVQRIRI